MVHFQIACDHALLPPNRRPLDFLIGEERRGEERWLAAGGWRLVTQSPICTPHSNEAVTTLAFLAPKGQKGTRRRPLCIAYNSMMQFCVIALTQLQVDYRFLVQLHSMAMPVWLGYNRAHISISITTTTTTTQQRTVF